MDRIRGHLQMRLSPLIIAQPGPVHVTATSYSGGISDTQVTLNYRYNNKS